MKFENGEVCGEMENREVIKRARKIFFQLKFECERNLKWNGNFSYDKKKNEKIKNKIENLKRKIEMEF